MKKENINLITRSIVTIALLVVVFNNAHWSVGLSLTLLFFATELTGYVVDKLIK